MLVTINVCFLDLCVIVIKIYRPTVMHISQYLLCMYLTSDVLWIWWFSHYPIIIFPPSHPIWPHDFPTILTSFSHYLAIIFPQSRHHFPTTPYDPTIFPPSRRAPRQKTRRQGDSAQILSRKLIRTRCHPLNNFHLQHLAFISLTVSARV